MFNILYTHKTNNKETHPNDDKKTDPWAMPTTSKAISQQKTQPANPYPKDNNAHATAAISDNNFATTNAPFQQNANNHTLFEAANQLLAASHIPLLGAETNSRYHPRTARHMSVDAYVFQSRPPQTHDRPTYCLITDHNFSNFSGYLPS